MQRSLVYNAIKPCSRCKETLFATQTNLHRIHLLPIHNFATEAIANHSSHSIYKDTTFHHPFASFPPTFSAHHHASDALRVYFGCTSITKYTRRTTSQLPHTQPKTASRHPKGVLVYFFLKNLFSIRNYWLFSASLLFFKHSASFCSISSLDRSLITIP